MATLQKKLGDSFENLLKENNDINLDNETLKDILDKIIDLAVKQDRGENIDSNIKAQTNNIIGLID